MCLDAQVRSRVIDLLLAAASAVAVPAFASETHRFDVPVEDAADAIRDFAAQASLQILVADANVKDKHLHPVNGEYSSDQGLHILLADSGLQPQYVGDRSVALITAVNSAPLDVTASAKHGKEGKSDSSDTFRVAQADQGAPAPLPSIERTGAAQTAQLQEVVVTARKRAERLIDTPQSVSVVSAGDLAKLGATQLRDYATSVPGLSFTTDGSGFSQVTLRGVTTGNLPVSPTVAIYVDDVPIGSTSAFGFGGRFGLDLGPFDLDRIEVLRGPQGTLYGASTMGGLIKYVGVSPDTDAMSGQVQSGISNTQFGGVSYDGAGAFNLPLLTDKAAVRISAYYSHDGGYIDDVALSQKDVNRGAIYGARADFLWKPTDQLTIRLGGLAQDIARDGHGTADYSFAGAPLYGDLKEYRLLGEPLDQHFRLGDMVAKYAFGPVTLSSISAYQTMQTEQVYDFSAEFVPAFGGAYSAVGLPDSTRTNKFTQELRLESAGEGRVQWLLGGFYSHESSEDRESFTLFGPTGLPVPDDLFIYATPSVYKEYAGFANVTFKITSKLDVTGGVRYSRDKQTYSESQTGAFGDVAVSGGSDEGVATYLANLRYHITPNTTAYARYATGYRPGGPNFVSDDPATGQPYAPATFQPDSLQSYEAGYKAESEDRRFAIDMDAYYIDWHNVQLLTQRGQFAVILNAPGGATVRGAELTLTALPIDGLSISGAFAYQDPRITAANADLGASAGERLPNVSHFTGALSGDYRLPLSSWKPSIGVMVRYVSDRAASFGNMAGAGPVPQYFLPAYASVDLRNGYQIGSVDLQLYIHNLFDRRGQLSADTSNGPFAEVAMSQPRTYGVRVSTRFQP